MTIHWCGTGLSALPGLRGLIASGAEICVWNRSPDKARALLGDLTDWIEPFDPATLAEALGPGDIVVSMLPGEWHVPLARLCLAEGAHFVSSSYVSPEMAALDAEARERGLCLVNEVGLDPGIDHLMAHVLVGDLRSMAPPPGTEVAFLSYCGGVPKRPNPLRYKFSWSPAGVLRALRAPSRSLRGGAETTARRPWEALSRYTAPLPAPETFEVYPNRDSLPFVAQYGLDPAWHLTEFVRGTLRLDGWATAWAPIFAELDSLPPGPEGEPGLTALSARLLEGNRYGADEPDRVVLCVDLRAGPAEAPQFHKTWTLDAWGDGRVSRTVAQAVQDIASGKTAPGCSTGPSTAAEAQRWLQALAPQAQHLALIDHLA